MYKVQFDNNIEIKVLFGNLFPLFLLFHDFLLYVPFNSLLLSINKIEHQSSQKQICLDTVKHTYMRLCRYKQNDN